jgi:hypothetical protein
VAEDNYPWFGLGVQSFGEFWGAPPSNDKSSIINRDGFIRRADKIGMGLNVQVE